jgi:hypothetical protein
LREPAAAASIAAWQEIIGDPEMMEQPVTLHWQSKEGYYTAVLTPDLFGGWVLITASNKRDGRPGRVNHKPMPDYAGGLKSLEEVRKRRRSEGYTLCTTGFMELDDLNPRSSANRSAETSAVLRAFRNLAIAPEQQAVLLNIDAATLDAYQDGKTLADDLTLLARVRLVMAIHKALHHLFAGVPEKARAWMRMPNPRFDQAQPLDLMLASLDGLKIVRSYLEGEVDALFEQPSAVTLPPDRACSLGRGS